MHFRDSQKTRWWICGALVLVTVAVYWRVGGFAFLNFDDPDYVTNNRNVTAGLTANGVIWAFTHAYASNWHPLTWISHMLDCQLFGSHSGGPHLVNLAFHTANAVILFLLLHQLTNAPWRSAVVAGFFALHPLHVESVAWISERKDVLSTFFGLLSLLAYSRWVRDRERSTGTERPPRGRWWTALLLFALGLLAKPMLVTLPFVLLLLDLWPLQRIENAGWKTFFRPSFLRLILEKWPWFALSALSCAATLYAQKAGGAVVALERFPFFWRGVNAIEAWFGYLEKTFWPTRLAVFYPLEHLRPVLPFILAGSCLMAISILAVATLRRHPSFGMGWLWFVGTLVPVIGLVQVGAQAMADRYTYLPLIGVFIAVVWGVADLLAGRRFAGLAATALAGLPLFLCAVLTATQVSVWKSSITLFEHALKTTHENAIAHNNFGNALAASGRNQEALPHFLKAVSLDPLNPLFHNDLGSTLAALGRNDEALAQYAEAVRLQPRDAVFQNNLGAALGRAGRIEAAMERYREAIRLRPDYAEAHNNLGEALTTQRQLAEAEIELNRALTIIPEYAEAHNNLGRTLALEGKLSEAVAQYQEALRLKPNQPVVHFNLGLSLWRLGRMGEAGEHLSEAVRLDPRSAEAQYELGRYLTESGQAARAIAHLRDAARLRPEWAEPLNALAWVLAMDDNAQVRDSAEAVRLAERAATLTAWKQPGILNTLAAAYAEAGRFDEATNAATQAIELARSSGRTNLVAQMQFALERYRQRRPLRQN